MAQITGVRFRGTGNIFYYSPGDWTLKIGDKVIVETARGVELGEIRMQPREVHEEKLKHPLKEIIRKATEDDLLRQKFNQEKEKDAFSICKQKIKEHGLDMKLVDAEYTFENNKLLFYFTSDDRVDFRSLVRDLASIFHTRIELRQIGVRDETRIMGGIGPCGRELCCKSWMTEFKHLSIKMAKEQSLSLNPSKISGVCGRLMCCLKHEEDTYEYLNAKMPRVGDIMRTADDKEGYVQNLNILRQTVRLVIENGDEKIIAEYPAEELTFIAHRGKRKLQERDTSSRREGSKETENTAQTTRTERGRREGYHRGEARQRGDGNSRGKAHPIGEGQKSRRPNRKGSAKTSERGRSRVGVNSQGGYSHEE